MFKRLKLWQRGQVLVFTALLLPVMLLILVCALNAGILYIEYTRLQNAADSAALAGASSYAQYCQKHLIGGTALTQPLLQLGAEDYATEVMKDTLKVNLPHGTITPEFPKFNRAQVGDEKANTHKVSLGFLGSFTVTDSYDYDYEITSNVELSETVPLLIVGNYDISTKSTAVQPLQENRSATKLFIKSRDYDIKKSALTQ